MSDLTPEDAEKLFAEVSTAIKSDDASLKLKELLPTESSEKEPPVTPTPPEKTEEQDTDSDDTKEEGQSEEQEEQQEEEDEEENKSPQEKKSAGEKKEPTTEEKTIEELKKQLEASNHALRSQVGRIPQLQREIARIDKKLEALNASPSSQASTKIKPKVEELLKDVKETDPALAKAVADAIAEAAGGVDDGAREQQRNDLIEERNELLAAHRQEQIDKLTSLYPNAAEVFASPHWAAWKKEQPQYILSLAESDSADAVAFAFKLYADAMRERYPELGKKPEDTQQTEVRETPDPAAAEKARQIEEERNRRNKTQPNLGTGKTGARVKEPTDPQALFEHFSKQIREERMG